MRIMFQGCGKLTFMDVRELAPGGLARFRHDLMRACTGGSQPPTSSTGRPSNYPAQPAPVHLGTGSASGVRPGTGAGLSNAPGTVSAVNSTSGALGSYPQPVQYLLLCINTRRYRVLRHVPIDPSMNDEKLFESVSKMYSEARKSHEWTLLLLFPGALSALCSQLAQRCPSFAPKWVRNLFSWEDWPRMEVIHRGVLIRVSVHRAIVVKDVCLMSISISTSV